MNRSQRQTDLNTQKAELCDRAIEALKATLSAIEGIGFACRRSTAEDSIDDEEMMSELLSHIADEVFGLSCEHGTLVAEHTRLTEAQRQLSEGR